MEAWLALQHILNIKSSNSELLEALGGLERQKHQVNLKVTKCSDPFSPFPLET